MLSIQVTSGLSIALTPCIGKVFTTLLRNRWLKFMLLNKYFDTSLQKAFMPSIPGCTEHQLKLCSVLSEAQSKHKALAVCWLDIANAYGSVHHSLIQFALQHYHAPPQFLSILQDLYSGLNATVITENWDTPLVSLQKGVYKGDPLSVVIFNTVMNTLIDSVTWPLLTQEFPITWVERELDSLATHYIKHWAGLTKSASTAILYLPN